MECEFKGFGCTFKGTESSLKRHYQTSQSQHSEMMLSSVKSSEAEKSKNEAQVQEVTAERDQLKQVIIDCREQQRQLQCAINESNSSINTERGSQEGNQRREESNRGILYETDASKEDGTNRGSQEGNLRRERERGILHETNASNEDSTIRGSQEEFQRRESEIENLVERQALNADSTNGSSILLGETLVGIQSQRSDTEAGSEETNEDNSYSAIENLHPDIRTEVVLPTPSLNETPDLKRRIDMHDSHFVQLDVQMAELDLRFQILETASYDGTLMWKLRDYARRKEDAVQGRTLSLYSQPFYTHRNGYKMCARVYLNGDGMGTGSHLSLFFVVMRGEYDNLLPWPFQQKVTMTLLDQETRQCNLSDSFRPDPSSSSFRKPTTDMNIASGCPLFVSHAVLETQKYVKEDTIMIKFQVNLANLNHP